MGHTPPVSAGAIDTLNELRIAAGRHRTVTINVKEFAQRRGLSAITTRDHIRMLEEVGQLSTRHVEGQRSALRIDFEA